nr:hypothetical protein [Tanacetum cinerariifolium]
MLSAVKDPLTFEELMAIPIYFSKLAMNHLKIDKLTKEHLIVLVYNLLNDTCRSSIDLEYNMEECYKALSDKLDWNNPEGDHCPIDLSKPLPFKGRPGHLTIVSEYFFNNDLEYLNSSEPENKCTTYITKTKAVRYELLVQHKLFYLDGEVIVDLAVALCMFTKSLIIKKRVEDFLLGVESYQKKLNIKKPQKDFLRISTKELYTPSFEPSGVIYEDLSHQKRLIQADKLYKFSDRTLKKVRVTLYHMLLNF